MSYDPSLFNINFQTRQKVIQKFKDPMKQNFTEVHTALTNKV